MSFCREPPSAAPPSRGGSNLPYPVTVIQTSLSSLTHVMALPVAVTATTTAPSGDVSGAAAAGEQGTSPAQPPARVIVEGGHEGSLLQTVSAGGSQCQVPPCSTGAADRGARRDVIWDQMRIADDSSLVRLVAGDTKNELVVRIAKDMKESQLRKTTCQRIEIARINAPPLAILLHERLPDDRCILVIAARYDAQKDCFELGVICVDSNRAEWRALQTGTVPTSVPVAEFYHSCFERRRGGAADDRQPMYIRQKRRVKHFVALPLSLTPLLTSADDVMPFPAGALKPSSLPRLGLELLRDGLALIYDATCKNGHLLCLDTTCTDGVESPATPIVASNALVIDLSPGIVIDHLCAPSTAILPVLHCWQPGEADLVAPTPTSSSSGPKNLMDTFMFNSDSAKVIHVVQGPTREEYDAARGVANASSKAVRVSKGGVWTNFVEQHHVSGMRRYSDMSKGSPCMVLFSPAAQLSEELYARVVKLLPEAVAIEYNPDRVYRRDYLLVQVFAAKVQDVGVIPRANSTFELYVSLQPFKRDALQAHLAVEASNRSDAAASADGANSSSASNIDPSADTVLNRSFGSSASKATSAPPAASAPNRSEYHRVTSASIVTARAIGLTAACDFPVLLVASQSCVVAVRLAPSPASDPIADILHVWYLRSASFDV